MEIQEFYLMIACTVTTVSMLIANRILKERKIRQVRKIILRRLH